MKLEHKNIHMGLKLESQIIFEFDGTINDRSSVGGEGAGLLKITPQFISWQRKGCEAKIVNLTELVEFLENGDD